MIQAIKDLNTPSLAEGLMFKRYKTLEKWEELYQADELANHIFLVKSGLLKINLPQEDGSTVIKSIAQTGEIIGLSPQIFQALATYEEKAIVISDYAEIHAINIANLNDENLKTLSSEIAPLFIKQMNYWRKRHLALQTKSANYRIKMVLKDLANQFGQQFTGETLLKLRLSHGEIAQLSDTSRQSVSTLLSEMKKSGILTYSRNRILFHNLNTI